jgi:branched-chain amino acid transport system permease protein
MAEEIDPTDRESIALARWEQRMRPALRPLLTEQLIEEHQRAPRGPHSDNLKRVLNYFRRSSALTPFVIVCTQPFREWRVARVTGVQGQAPIFVDEQVWSSEAEAMHAIFLKRIDETMRD